MLHSAGTEYFFFSLAEGGGRNGVEEKESITRRSRRSLLPAVGVAGVLRGWWVSQRITTKLPASCRTACAVARRVPTHTRKKNWLTRSRCVFLLHEGSIHHAISDVLSIDPPCLCHAPRLFCRFPTRSSGAPSLLNSSPLTRLHPYPVFLADGGALWSGACDRCVISAAVCRTAPGIRPILLCPPRFAQIREGYWSALSPLTLFTASLEKKERRR